MYHYQWNCISAWRTKSLPLPEALLYYWLSWIPISTQLPWTDESHCPRIQFKLQLLYPDKEAKAGLELIFSAVRTWKQERESHFTRGIFLCFFVFWGFESVRIVWFSIFKLWLLRHRHFLMYIYWIKVPFKEKRGFCPFLWVWLTTQFKTFQRLAAASFLGSNFNPLTFYVLCNTNLKMCCFIIPGLSHISSNVNNFRHQFK